MLKQYSLIAKSVENLFYPYVEIVIHDIPKQKIAYIGNNISHRKVGDDSILEDISFDSVKEIVGPYEKINFDGRKLKSISAVIKNEQGEPKYLFCANFDCSALLQLTATVDAFIGKPLFDKSSAQIFKDDWQEKINIFIHESLKKKGRTIMTASKEDKRYLVLQLSKKGAFKAKNSTTYAANVLKISRASLYNYLNNNEGQ